MKAIEKAAPDAIPKAALKVTANEWCKGTKFNSQYQTVYHSFLQHPKTMKQVSVETGIERCNITRFISQMLRDGSIELIHKGNCPITGLSGVGFYQSVPDISPSPYVATPSADLNRSARHASMSSAPSAAINRLTADKAGQLDFFGIYEQVQK